MPSTTSLAAALLPLLLPAEALNNGVGQTPIMGWTSWITTGQGDLWQGSPFNVSARALKETGDYLVSTGLRDAGYDYVLLDDGWPACSEWRRGIAEASSCLNPSPRLDGGNVLVDKLKFPESAPGANDGIKVVADYLHAKGLKMGIYTAPHGRTCGGYWGMLGHEATDAQMFADWGIVRHCRHLRRRRIRSRLIPSHRSPLTAHRRPWRVRSVYRAFAGLSQAGYGLPGRRLHSRRHCPRLPRACEGRPQQDRPTNGLL